MKESIGYKMNYRPKDKCNDINCPYHGELSVRGKTFEGEIVSDSMNKSVKVQWETKVKEKKFSRYLKKKSSVIAHNPECISAKKGDRVIVGETRPLSKTKHFTILKVLNEEEGNEK
jgi:small subunit ribosomal protein S17